MVPIHVTTLIQLLTNVAGYSKNCHSRSNPMLPRRPAAKQAAMLHGSKKKGHVLNDRFVVQPTAQLSHSFCSLSLLGVVDSRSSANDGRSTGGRRARITIPKFHCLDS